METARRKAYLLIRPGEDAYFEAEYCKYFPNVSYCALFERYPAAETNVLVCLMSEDNPSNQNPYQLLRIDPGGEEKEIGLCVPLKVVKSEKEAADIVVANMRGNALLHALFTADPIVDEGSA